MQLGKHGEEMFQGPRQVSLNLLLFSSSSLRFRFDHGPEKNNLGKGERLGGEREREKDLKNIESHRILLLPLKHYEL